LVQFSHPPPDVAFLIGWAVIYVTAEKRKVTAADKHREMWNIQCTLCKYIGHFITKKEESERTIWTLYFMFFSNIIIQVILYAPPLTNSLIYIYKNKLSVFVCVCVCVCRVTSCLCVDWRHVFDWRNYRPGHRDTNDDRDTGT